jgi:GTP pyrophosphokinase
MESLQHSAPGSLTNDTDGDLARLVSWCDDEIRAAELGIESFHQTVNERAEILRGIGVDDEALGAIWIYTTLELAATTPERIAKHFDSGMINLVTGVKRMDVISQRSGSDSVTSDDNFRKMLISMIDDVRVVLIRLACQVERMRTAKSTLDETQCRLLGRETLEVFAPLANRLGIWQLKWELEDYAFRYLHADIYKSLAGRLAERRVDRERYIKDFTDTLHAELVKAELVGEVVGRPKHIYSIYRKMHKKGLEFENIHDMRAVRVLVDNVGDCYAALGLVHTRWPHVSGEFDDYIATPKENGYKSIHTAVIGPAGRVVEVQIRTHDMHSENELGIAAHWRYKENSRHDTSTDSKILWLRQLLEWKEEIGDNSGLFEQFRNDTAEERVYVFSPKGKVVDLPFGSTPLDFAYAIHTDVGHRCRGAKVNGRMVPLNYQLTTGEQVAVLTQRSGTPSRDWLNASLGYIHTQKARSRIQRWFKEADYDHNVAAGRVSLERELYRLGASDTAFMDLASPRGYRKVEDFLAAIGGGDIKLSQAVSNLRPNIDKRANILSIGNTSSKKPSPARGMEVQGVGNLLTQFAACCNPLPGDNIVGYITQTRGISIHRNDCSNILRLDSAREDRLIQVTWGSTSQEMFAVNVEITAIDRKGLLYDVSRILSDVGVNVLSTATASNKKDHTAHMRIRIEIADVQELSQLLSRIMLVPNVTDARRTSN